MKINFSKLLALLLALCMIFSIAACNDTPVDSDQPDVNDNDTVNNNNDTSDENDDDEVVLEGYIGAPTGPIKNVIFIIGDGMGDEHIKAGALDRGTPYSFQSWHHAMINTDSIDEDTGEFVTTDSAASSTALATGTLTNNDLVGKAPDGTSLATIMDYAKACGKSTGILTTDYLYGATPAGFSAHAADRDDRLNITKTQLRSGVNFLGGLNSVIYNQTLYKKLINASPYYFTTTPDDPKILENEQVMLSLNIENGEADSITLADATKVALEYLQRDSDGFVLMIEQAYIDKYSHNNEFGNMLGRMHSLGDTVDAVMEWVGDRDDTVVLVSADHETGDLYVSADEEFGYSYNGQNGSFNFGWGSDNHTSAFVSLYVYGTDERFCEYPTYTENELVPNLIKNTDIFTLMKRLVTTGERSPDT